jgi:hypothetical protein
MEPQDPFVAPDDPELLKEIHEGELLWNQISRPELTLPEFARTLRALSATDLRRIVLARVYEHHRSARTSGT